MNCSSRQPGASLWAALESKFSGDNVITDARDQYNDKPGTADVNVDYSQLVLGQCPENEDGEETSAKRPKRFYSLAEKLRAVEFAESTSTNKAARQYNVDRKRIQEWRLAKDKIIYACDNWSDGNRKRQRGGGKKPISNDLEQFLLNWIDAEMKQPQPKISWRILQAKAREIFNQLKNEGMIKTQVFKASNGWLQNFLKRHTFAFPTSRNIERDSCSGN